MLYAFLNKNTKKVHCVVRNNTEEGATSEDFDVIPLSNNSTIPVPGDLWNGESFVSDTTKIIRTFTPLAIIQALRNFNNS